jgi:outer membrane protein assembly factor BamB
MANLGAHGSRHTHHVAQGTEDLQHVDCSGHSVRSVRGRLKIAAGTAFAVVVASVIAPSGVVHGAQVHSSGGAGFGSDWPTYHHDALGSGVDATGTDLNPATPAWTSAHLDGQIYGEPLVMTGRVVVATENDTVYELSANSGAVLWSTHIGPAVSSGDLPCGNISPTVGITGTPVIDPARGEIFVVTDEISGSSAQHFLVGLDLSSGAILVHQAISLPGSDQLAQLQRTGLVLDDGNVVEGFGGNAGDCGNYNGWIVSIPEGGGPEHSFEVASAAGDSQGAVWMGGAAPIVDSSGNVWFASGNSAFTSSSDSYDNSDGVIELNSAMAELQFFAPSAWYDDNGADFDLGSSAPVLTSSGLAFQVGKSQTAYVMSSSSLGGVGGQLASSGSFCGNDVDGGSALAGDVVYSPCLNGVTATQVTPSPPTITPMWQSSTGSSGPPIVAGGLVWTIDPNSATLYGLDATTGNAVQSFSLGSEANHFPTPTVADGVLLAPSSDQIYAFDGPAGLPPPPFAGFQITTTVLPSATRGKTYRVQLYASGGIPPYRWKRTGGSLPRGLRLHPNGVLSGRPSAHLSPGVFTLTVQVSTHKERGHPKQTATSTLNLMLQ